MLFELIRHLHAYVFVDDDIHACSVMADGGGEKMAGRRVGVQMTRQETRFALFAPTQKFTNGSTSQTDYQQYRHGALTSLHTFKGPPARSITTSTAKMSPGTAASGAVSPRERQQSDESRRRVEGTRRCDEARKRRDQRQI